MKIKLLKLLKEYLSAFWIAMLCVIVWGMLYYGYLVLSTTFHIPRGVFWVAILIIPALCVAANRLLKRIKGDSEVQE